MYNRLHDARFRVVFKFIIILIISFVIYGTYVGNTIYHNISMHYYESMDATVDVTTDMLSQTLELIRGTTYALSASDSVGHWMADKNFFSGENKNSYLNREELNREIQNTLINNNVWQFELFDYITIYQNEDLLAYSYTRPFSTKLIIEETGAVYNSIKDREDYALILPPTPEDKTMYTTLRIQADFKSNDSLFIIGATKEEYLRKNYENFAPYEGSLIYVIDNEGIVYSSNVEEQLGTKLPEEILCGKARNARTEVKYNGVTYVAVDRKVNQEFSFVYLIPKPEIVKMALRGMKSFVLISVLIMVVLVSAAAFSSLRVTAFIKDFIYAMRRVREKDYDTRMEKYDEPELDELVDTFNSMTSELKTLIKTTYESRILMNEMEINFLQHQMNPHFLFNILLTIQIKAKMSGDETVCKMISSLSVLLRSGIYADKRALITIKEELKYVDYYLWLQKQRYEDRLTYSIEVEDESILQCEIPRLIIEPMVENAIVHGIETISEEGHVQVSLSYEGDDIVIHVADNGIGFDAAAMMDGDVDVQDGIHKREKIGLRNTNQRIKLMYGEPYGLEIRSEKNKGTDIEIRIPTKGLENVDD